MSAASTLTALDVGERPRILLVRLSAIGDCLHAVPTLLALRARFPQAHLGWAVERTVHALLEGHPAVDRFHVFPRHLFKHKQGSWSDRLRSLFAFRRELRTARYEIAIDLQGLTKSGLVAWWSGAKTRIGFRGADSRELSALFANVRVEPPAGARHVVERNLALLEPLLGGGGPAVRWGMPSYEPERAEVASFLAAMKTKACPRFAVINPGATWKTKRWAPERFGAVARALVASGVCNVAATWAGEEEREAAERIVAGANAGNVAGRSARALLAPPTGLRALAALTAEAALFVGNDTGPLHLAVALGVPCVAVFGASDPERNGPYGSAHRVAAAGPDCRPCWKKTCRRGDLACLERVEPEAVVAACLSILAEAAKEDV